MFLLGKKSPETGNGSPSPSPADSVTSTDSNFSDEDLTALVKRTWREKLELGRERDEITLVSKKDSSSDRDYPSSITGCSAGDNADEDIYTVEVGKATSSWKNGVQDYIFTNRQRTFARIQILQAARVVLTLILVALTVFTIHYSLACFGSADKDACEVAT
ncbi:unnamed protein product, partial [Amoebophrya sp. A25]|eukprot:GSA25T00015667001.1